MSGIGVITNPRSRKNLRNPKLAHQLGYILGEKGHFEQPGDLDELELTAERFLEHEIDILCVNGGDGTLHKALTAMVKVYGDTPLPRVALLRGGTMNTIAHGLRLRGRPADLLEYVVSRYHADVPMPHVRRWLLEIDGQEYGFLFANGLIPRFLEQYYDAPQPTPKRAVWLLMRTVMSAFVGGQMAARLTAKVECRAAVDGEEWPLGSWITVAAGTVDDIGVGFRPFYLAPRYPGKMHAVGIGCSAPRFAMQFPRIYRAQPTTDPDIHDAICEELLLSADEPIAYMIDGDFHRGGQTVTVRMGPPVDLIVPDR